MFDNSFPKIKQGNYQTDPLIDSNLDNRLGITLVIRPSLEVKNNIQKLLDQFKNVDPAQYYYRNSDIHITLLSVIGCYEGFDLQNIEIPQYVNAIQKAIQNFPPFEIEFKGITTSTSSVIIQGFFANNQLNDLRNAIRDELNQHSDLELKMDIRYPIQTAHSTVIRFRNAIQNLPDFVQIIENYRDYDFGKFTFDSFELVYNDWYQKIERVETLATFHLK
ncbi:mutarotase [Rhizosphaericola mali]|uniref:Mutarotase n=2 Tax=Rhizosphaericola mali TaxID=2545455 RepID=A0A5P2FXP0_9BACT|nr:mutarotase [Rhizosphaericola mali]